MTWSVPLTDIDVPEEDVEAVLDCLRSGWLTMGPRTQAFEEALRRATSARATRSRCRAARRRCTSPAWPPASAPATR